jgi:hypothetical protein
VFWGGHAECRTKNVNPEEGGSRFLWNCYLSTKLHHTNFPPASKLKKGIVSLYCIYIGCSELAIYVHAYAVPFPCLYRLPQLTRELRGSFCSWMGHISSLCRHTPGRHHKRYVSRNLYQGRGSSCYVTATRNKLTRRRQEGNKLQRERESGLHVLDTRTVLAIVWTCTEC